MVKAGIEADLQRIVAQQPGADAVEGAGPGQRVGDDGGVAAQHLAGDALDPPGHFRRGAARKGHQQDAPRIGALDDQMRDAVRQRVGLAGTGAGDDQQRPGDLAVAMLDGLTLLRRSAWRDRRGCERSNHGRRGSSPIKHRFCFVRNGFIFRSQKDRDGAPTLKGERDGKPPISPVEGNAGRVEGRECT